MKKLPKMISKKWLCKNGLPVGDDFFDAAITEGEILVNFISVCKKINPNEHAAIKIKKARTFYWDEYFKQKEKAI